MKKNITALDVAKKAGVSPTTVSFVLNNVTGMRIPDQTRQRVLQAAEELNYHPNSSAQKMARGKTNVIGLVIRQNPEKAYADLFLPQVMQGINSVTRKAGYHILLIPLPPEEDGGEFSRLIRERHVDGLLISGPTEEDDLELNSLFEEGAKIVLMGALKDSMIPMVDIDNRKAACEAVSHLLDLNHQHIAFISNAPFNYLSSQDRLAGYKEALESKGISFNKDLIFIADRTPESGHLAMKSLLSRNNFPSAVFIASDTVALGALHTLHEANIKIPDEMAVVGFDDIPLSEYINPPLSTVHLPAYSLGQASASLLIQQLTEQIPQQDQILLKTRLVIRSTSGKQVISP